ncbi:IS30 family transposase, partial [Bacteroidales bacterium OttesenSCG-928-B11]|nr:IS30 family transposase [Bacteroidales bacterium OttesenSCG-928-B11]
MRHLTCEQRYTISILKNLNKTQKEISEAIGVHKSTISRELRRNKDKRSGEYRYDLAERKYRARLKEKPKNSRVSEELLAYVKELLREDYSPEQIYGRSKADNMDCISHETIYQIIWKDKREGGTLYKHLRRQGRKYRKRGALKDSRGLIKNRVSIEERPVIVDEKIR